MTAVLNSLNSLFNYATGELFTLSWQGSLLLCAVLYGSMETKYDPKSKEIEKMRLKENVRLESDIFNLKCQILRLSSTKRKRLSALGLPLEMEFRNESDSSSKARAERLVYDPEKNTFTLTGNAEITPMNSNGKPVTIIGEKITLVMSDKGKIQILVDKGGKESPVAIVK